MLTATVDEQTNDLADTDERTRKALLEQGTPHDRELRDLDVVLDRATVKTSREQQHVAQERITEAFIQQRAGRAPRRLQGRLIQARQMGIQCPEAIDGTGEFAGDIRLEIREAIVHAQVPAGHGDAGAHLGTKVELFPANAELAHQLDQRGPLRPLGHPIGEGVQAYVVLALPAGVKGVQATRGVMPLEDEDLLPEHPKAHGGREAGHAGADDDRIVMGTRDAHRPTVQDRGPGSSERIKARSTAGPLRPRGSLDRG